MCDYLSDLELKLIHISKRSPVCHSSLCPNTSIINSHDIDRVGQTIPGFQEEGFQLLLSSQFWKVIANLYIYIISFVNYIQHDITMAKCKTAVTSLTHWNYSNLALSHRYDVNTNSKLHVAHIGPTWVLSAPGVPHVGPINLAIRVLWSGPQAGLNHC